MIILKVVSAENQGTFSDYHRNDGPNSYYRYSIGIRIGVTWSYELIGSTACMGIFSVDANAVNEYTGSRLSKN